MHIGLICQQSPDESSDSMTLRGSSWWGHGGMESWVMGRHGEMCGSEVSPGSSWPSAVAGAHAGPVRSSGPGPAEDSQKAKVKMLHLFSSLLSQDT